MDFKDILVSVDATDAGERRLRLAAAIAREHQAHLSAAYVLLAAAAGTAEGGRIATVPHLVSPPAGANATGAAALAEIIEQRFRETVGPHAIASDWHLFEEREGENLVALLKAVDLAVFGQGAPDYRLPSGFRPEDIVIASGRPVIIVPYAGTFDAVGRRVLVAWDETREASRALHDSLPLIAKAEAVTVMTVRTREASFEHDGPSLDRIVRHLERHGIPARAEETLRGDLPIADVLLSRAADLGVDLIVAGAYHHSPIREALLGGVSRELLDHMTVPVLMSH
jgi:nucleotide-binding universal stress UspA family protein